MWCCLKLHNLPQVRTIERQNTRIENYRNIKSDNTMAKCDYCGTTILLGGVKDQGYRFCNATCQLNGRALIAANQVPVEVLDEQVRAVHQGKCPCCSSRGPIDVHTSHRVWSAFVLTSWVSRPHVCCGKCGRLEQIKDCLFSLFLGWWGFPWGLIVTPIQIIRNLVGLLRQPDPYQPSRKLRRLVLIHIGTNIMRSRS